MSRTQLETPWSDEATMDGHSRTLAFRFLESDLPGAVPAIGDDATVLGFPTGFVIERRSYERTGARDGGVSGERVYTMTVTAIDKDGQPQDYNDTDDFPDKLDDNESVSEYNQDASGNKWFTPGIIRMKIRNVLRTTWENARATEEAKVGMINSGAGDPVSGCTAEEWMLIDIKCQKRTRARVRLTYVYQRAGRNKIGVQQTWAQIGTADGATYASGTIKWGV